MNGHRHNNGDGRWILCRYDADKKEKGEPNYDAVAAPIELKQHSSISIACIVLEEGLERCLVTCDDESPVEYPQRDDALLLHCRLPKSSAAPSSLLQQAKEEEEDAEPYASILGLMEDYQDGLRRQQKHQKQEQAATNGSGNRSGPTVHVSTYRGGLLVDEPNKDNCSCPVPAPHSEWKCHPRPRASENVHVPQVEPPQDDCRMTWVDLSSWRYKTEINSATTTANTNGGSNPNDALVPSLASVVHFLRCLLGSSHQASPWCPTDEQRSKVSIHNDNTDAVALLLPDQAPRRLLKFRVGDICPSWALYSVSNVRVPMSSVTSAAPWLPWENSTSEVPTTIMPATLLIYRRLPPRPQMSLQEPRSKQASPVPTTSLPDGCLWETYVVYEESDDNGNTPASVDAQKKALKRLMLRMTAQPYISYQQFYSPSIWQHLLDQWTVIRDESKTIAHWTAWPERQHYSKAADNDDDEDPNAPPPWTVFPLCHCFPADDPSRKQWIDATCAFVPRTTQLLQQMGPVLRTALFSRLDPETTLEAHTGWADLANHVVRLHLPLTVPPGDLCGAWVDGCVETHAAGRLLVFDDSKVHRAFNYSREERVVLILDLARPPELPLGTATGGHTDELDEFIAQMNLGPR